MSEHRQYQIVSYLFAVVFAVIIPLTLLSPVWYWQMPLAQLSWQIHATSLALILLGVWLAIVAYVVPTKTLAKILDSAQLGVPFLVIPYALYVGTKAILFKNTSL